MSWFCCIEHCQLFVKPLSRNLQSCQICLTRHCNAPKCPSQVVRSLLWSDSGVLLSGGEDARLVQWSVQPAAGGEETQTIHKPSQRVSNTVTRKDQAARRRQFPY